MASDRIFGLICLAISVFYVFSAFQIQTSFLSDPVGPKAFPILDRSSRGHLFAGDPCQNRS